jgi:hypothetical protein
MLPVLQYQPVEYAWDARFVEDHLQGDDNYNFLCSVYGKDVVDALLDTNTLAKWEITAIAEANYWEGDELWKQRTVIEFKVNDPCTLMAACNILDPIFEQERATNYITKPYTFVIHAKAFVKTGVRRATNRNRRKT